MGQILHMLIGHALNADQEAEENRRANELLKIQQQDELRKAAGEGGLLENDPDAVANVASNTPYTDSTFNANNITRVRPSNPALDIQSGYKGTEAANKFNTGQMQLETSRARQLADDPTLEQNRIAAATKGYQDKALFDQNQLINARAANLGNQRDDWALYMPQDSDIPAQDKADALSDINKYGAKGLSEGYTGAELGQQKSIADTDEATARADYYRARPTVPTEKPVPHYDQDGNATIFNPADNTITKHMVEKDPKTQMPTGRYKVIKTDLKTGATFEQRPETSRAILGPVNKSMATKPRSSIMDDIGPSISGAARRAGSAINDSLTIPFVNNSRPSDMIDQGANTIRNFRYENADAIQGIKDKIGDTLTNTRDYFGDKIFEGDNYLQQLINAYKSKLGRKYTPPPAE